MQPLKIITLFCLLLSPFFTNAQQYQLNVRISIHNSRVNNGPIEYVKNVKVNTELSPSGITDNKGRLELNFIDVEPNSIINLIVEKNGYEVVNKDVISDLQISKNPSIHIFLAEKGKLEKMEKHLFEFSLRNMRERKDSIFHLLNLKAVSEKSIVEELENNLGQKISDEMEAKLLLNQSIKDLEYELPKLVHQMAVVNLDFASGRYKKAYEFFTKDQLEQAIEILDEKELNASFEKILSSIEKAKKSTESYQKIFNIRRIQIDNVLESFELKQTLLKLAFRFVEADELNGEIAKMKTLITDDQQPEILLDENEPEDIVAYDQAVNILLYDTMHLALIDTNWVELEMENLIAESEVEAERTGDPKAKTILEALPYNSTSRISGIDFENTLFVKRDRIPSSIPIYEQPNSVLISSQKVINTSPNTVVETNIENKWLEFSEVVEPEIPVVSSPDSQPKTEVKEASSSERIVFTEIIEPNYQSYKITKKTSFRQKATASSKVLKRLKVGTEVKVIDQVDRYWCKAILNGKVGYVKVLLLEKMK